MMTRNECSSSESFSHANTAHLLSGGGSIHGTTQNNSEPHLSLSGPSFLKPLPPQHDPFDFDFHQYQKDNDIESFFLTSPEEIGFLPAGVSRQTFRSRETEDLDFEIEAINHQPRMLPLLPRCDSNRRDEVIPSFDPVSTPTRTIFVPEQRPAASSQSQRHVSPAPFSSRVVPLPANFSCAQTSISYPCNARSTSSPPFLTSATPESPSRKRRVTVDFTTPTQASKKRSLQGQYLTPCTNTPHCNNSSPLTPKTSCNTRLNFTSLSARPQEVRTRIPLYQDDLSDVKPYQTPTPEDQTKMDDFSWMNQGPPALKQTKREFIC